MDLFGGFSFLVIPGFFWLVNFKAQTEMIRDPVLVGEVSFGACHPRTAMQDPEFPGSHLSVQAGIPYTYGVY